MLTTKSSSPWLRLQVVCLILVVDIQQAGGVLANKTIRVGYLVSYLPAAGAINVAIENAQNDGFLRDYHFRYVPAQKPG